MSLDAFISGQSAITPSGMHAVNTDPEDARRRVENRLDVSISSSDADVYDDEDSSPQVLAERTSNLISSYRDYIHGQEDEEMLGRITGVGSGGAGGGPGGGGHSGGFSDGRPISSSHRHRNSASVPGTGVAPLLREWNASSSTPHGRCEQLDTSGCDSLDELYDPVDDCLKGHSRRRYRYAHPVFRSKKFRKLVLGVVVVAVIMGVIGVAFKDKSGEDLPDWDEELKEAIADERSGSGDLGGSGAGGDVGLKHQEIGIANVLPKPVDEPADEDPAEDPAEEEPLDGSGEEDNGNAAATMVEEVLEQEEEEQEQEGAEMERPVGVEEDANEEEEGEEGAEMERPVEVEEDANEEDAKVGSEDQPEAESAEDSEGEEEDKQEVEEKEEDEPATSTSPEDQKQEPTAAKADVNYSGVEAITRHILCCSRPSSSGGKTRNLLSPAEAASEYARAEKYRPVWYDRSHGWDGTTYSEGLQYCTSQGEGRMLCPYEVYCPTGPHHIPLGGYRGVGNFDNDSSSAGASSRSPIADYPNGWVQVGTKNSCVQYTILENGAAMESGGKAILDEIVEGKSGNDAAASEAEAEEEEMGEVAGNEEREEHLQQGQAQQKQQEESLVEESHVPVSGAGNNKPANGGLSPETEELLAKAKAQEEYKLGHEAQAAGSKPGGKPGGPSSMTEELVAKAEEEEQEYKQAQDVASKSEEGASESQQQQQQPVPVKVTPVSAPQSQPAPSSSSSQMDIANELHQKYKPLWLSSAEGWNGGSHSDAVSFCSSIRGKKLCPYSAMCPHGPGGVVMGGRHRLEFSVQGEQYAPVMGGDNHWVMIGTGSDDDDGGARCKTHRQLEGKAPEWGLSGERREVKRHVMCCTIE